MTRKKARKTINTASTSSYTFTDAERMKENFFAHTTVRQAQKISGDAGIAEIDSDIEKIKLSANEEIFNANKQQLISKMQDLVNKCQVTSATSVEVEKLEPKHQKELLDLESQARAAESAYKENLQKANDETDEKKKAEFIVLANRAARDAEKIKQKIKTNPLMEVGNFNYLDDLKKLAKGNVPKNASSDRKTPHNNPNNNHQDSDNFLTKYRKEIFMAVVGLGIIKRNLLLLTVGVGLAYYFFIYLPEEEEENNKKRQNNQHSSTSSLIGEYQKFASLFPNGDKDERFYFSRAAPYTIHFPPSLQEYYEKERVESNPVRGEKDRNKKDNSAIFYGAPGIVKDYGFEREDNGEVRYILFVDEANQISNNSLIFQPNQLKFLKDCLERVNQNERSNNLWVFATNHLDQIEEAVYREGRLSNPLDFKTEEDERDESGKKTGNKVKEDIEIGEFLEFFWYVKKKYLSSYDGSFENISKLTTETVLDTRLVELIEVLDEKLRKLVEEVNKSRLEGKEQIMGGIDRIIKRLCACIGCAVGIGLCVASAGMATPFVAANQENEEAEKRLMEDKRYKDISDATKKQFQDNQNNQNLLLNLAGKLNGTVPRESHETDEYLKQQIAIVQSSLKAGEERYNQLLADLDKVRKEILGGFNFMKLLGFDKMKTMDKQISKVLKTPNIKDFGLAYPTVEMDFELLKKVLTDLDNFLKENASPQTQDKASGDKSRRNKANRECYHEKITSKLSENFTTQEQLKQTYQEVVRELNQLARSKGIDDPIDLPSKNTNPSTNPQESFP
ncbi:8412_t:CDS:10 [Ambispora leptoticha]|uniref:8412_t:CDS:1 n=1 Tax=Ambispora leptoticha TaxID=144679 RepID=A0A9N8YPR2_9GLOM|nr:8412_t:CDS:10 [Ambispora leptoticha]